MCTNKVNGVNFDFMTTLAHLLYEVEIVSTKYLKTSFPLIVIQ